MIEIKRAYEEPGSKDGTRFLVERLWPRGVTKERLRLDGWLKDVAPSTTLRRWFQHDPAKWAEFRRRYLTELEENPDSWKALLAQARRGRVTLVYGAHDVEHNGALVLKEFLQQKIKRKPRAHKAA
jgi:uncharacterized protein YeaO (DUF488 family)